MFPRNWKIAKVTLIYKMAVFTEYLLSHIYTYKIHNFF